MCPVPLSISGRVMKTEGSGLMEARRGLGDRQGAGVGGGVRGWLLPASWIRDGRTHRPGGTHYFPCCYV